MNKELAIKMLSTPRLSIVSAQYHAKKRVIAKHWLKRNGYSYIANMDVMFLNLGPCPKFACTPRYILERVL